ncbi:hypothetical protein V2J09_008754 [Rumex salicifolius]
MADGAWSRQGPPLYTSSSSVSLLKRPRTEYEPQASGLGSGQEMRNYMMQNDNQGALRVVRDTDSIGSAYDRYLQATQASSYGSGDSSNLGTSGLGRSILGTSSGIESMGRSLSRPVGSDLLQTSQGIGVIGRHPADMVGRQGHENISLPPSASKTLYIEGLPSDITRREVARYREVRLVFKDSKHRGDPIILCFVDFADPACAATAMTALQGKSCSHNKSRVGTKWMNTVQIPLFCAFSFLDLRVLDLLLGHVAGDRHCCTARVF